jgi:hypothetical protein
MQLYRRHSGSHAIKVTGAPNNLDVVASRRGNTVFLHIANTERMRSAKTTIQIAGHAIQGGRVFEISEDPMVELSFLNSADAMKTIEKPFAASGGWEFPPASVSAIEIDIDG